MAGTSEKQLNAKKRICGAPKEPDGRNRSKAIECKEKNLWGSEGVKWQYFGI